MGQSFVNGQFFIATLNNQRVYVFQRDSKDGKHPAQFKLHFTKTINAVYVSSVQNPC